MNKYALSAVLSLAILNAGALAAQKNEPLKPAVEQKAGVSDGTDAWMKQVREKLRRNQELSPMDFDSYFSDNLFKPSDEPLLEMERMEKKIEEDMEAEKKLFQRSYREWHAVRAEMPELDTQITPSGDKIVVSVKKPVEKPESMKVSVKKNMITIDFSSRSETENKKAGEMVKSSSFIRSSKIMSVPAGADPDRFTIEDTGSRMNIVFAKKAQK